MLLDTRYTITHHKVRLRVYAQEATPAPRPGEEWIALADLPTLPMAAPFRRAVQALVRGVRVLGTGLGSLDASDGTIVFHHDEKTIGRNLAEVGKGVIPGLEKLLAAIREGREYRGTEYSLGLGERAYKVNVPLPVGDTGTAWSFGAEVPLSTIQGEAERLTLKIFPAALGGFLLMAARGTSPSAGRPSGSFPRTNWGGWPTRWRTWWASSENWWSRSVPSPNPP